MELLPHNHKTSSQIPPPASFFFKKTDRKQYLAIDLSEGRELGLDHPRSGTQRDRHSDLGYCWDCDDGSLFIFVGVFVCQCTFKFFGSFIFDFFAAAAEVQWDGRIEMMWRL